MNRYEYLDCPLENLLNILFLHWKEIKMQNKVPFVLSEGDIITQVDKYQPVMIGIETNFLPYKDVVPLCFPYFYIKRKHRKVENLPPQLSNCKGFYYYLFYAENEDKETFLKYLKGFLDEYYGHFKADYVLIDSWIIVKPDKYVKISKYPIFNHIPWLRQNLNRVTLFLSELKREPLAYHVIKDQMPLDFLSHPELAKVYETYAPYITYFANLLDINEGLIALACLYPHILKIKDIKVFPNFYYGNHLYSMDVEIYNERKTFYCQTPQFVAYSKFASIYAKYIDPLGPTIRLETTLNAKLDNKFLNNIHRTFCKLLDIPEFAERTFESKLAQTEWIVRGRDFFVQMIKERLLQLFDRLISLNTPELRKNLQECFETLTTAGGEMPFCLEEDDMGIWITMPWKTLYVILHQFANEIHGYSHPRTVHRYIDSCLTIENYEDFKIGFCTIIYKGKPLTRRIYRLLYKAKKSVYREATERILESLLEGRDFVVHEKTEEIIAELLKDLGIVKKYKNVYKLASEKTLDVIEVLRSILEGYSYNIKMAPTKYQFLRKLLLLNGIQNYEIGDNFIVGDKEKAQDIEIIFEGVEGIAKVR